MSLIGDALKRQMEKKGETSPLSPPPAPPVVPSEPPAPSATPALTLRSKVAGAGPHDGDKEELPAVAHKPVKHRPVMELVLLGIGVILLILAGFTAYSWLIGKKSVPVVDPAAVTAPAKPATPPSSSSSPAPAPPAAPPTQPAAATPPSPETAITPAAPVTTPAATPSPTAASDPVTVQAEHPATDAVANPSTEKESAPVADATTPSSKPAEPVTVMWPTFSIQAAMGSGTSGSVMINGKIMAIGDNFFGVKILEITPRGVRVEYEGEQRIVPVRR